MNIPEDLVENVLKKIDKILEEKVDLDRKNIDFSKNTAFLYQNGRIKPVKNPKIPDINNLLGIDEQKKQIVYNTEKFVRGKPSNHVLLWGERGTGKSSLVKGLLKLFSKDGLRLILIPKKDLLKIWDLYDLLEEFKDFRFILFVDDLSFEENQQDYKELKTVIDGGLKGLPENIRFYVTSNRKNLIPVKFSDRNSDDTRISDTIEEKLSLVDRFGLRIGFFHMSQDTYLKIVDMYAKMYNIKMENRELHRKALQFSLNYGARNGRVALQFIQSL